MKEKILILSAIMIFSLMPIVNADTIILRPMHPENFI